MDYEITFLFRKYERGKSNASESLIDYEERCEIPRRTYGDGETIESEIFIIALKFKAILLR